MWTVATLKSSTSNAQTHNLTGGFGTFIRPVVPYLTQNLTFQKCHVRTYGNVTLKTLTLSVGVTVSDVVVGNTFTTLPSPATCTMASLNLSVVASASVSARGSQTSEHSGPALDATGFLASSERPVRKIYGADANESTALEIGDGILHLGEIAVGTVTLEGDVAGDAVSQTLLVHDFAQEHPIDWELEFPQLEELMQTICQREHRIPQKKHPTRKRVAAFENNAWQMTVKGIRTAV